MNKNLSVRNKNFYIDRINNRIIIPNKKHLKKLLLFLDGLMLERDGWKVKEK